MLPLYGAITFSAQQVQCTGFSVYLHSVVIQSVWGRNTRKTRGWQNYRVINGYIDYCPRSVCCSVEWVKEPCYIDRYILYLHDIKVSGVWRLLYIKLLFLGQLSVVVCMYVFFISL